jgi:type IV pilus assembly protein PilN
MIKINLLPFRAAKKKENVRRQISIYFLSLILLGAGMTYLYISTNTQLKEVRHIKAEKQKELNSYSDTTRKIAKLKKKISELQTKLDVILKLEEKKTGPVRLLDELAQAIPPDQLWLNSLSERGKSLQLSGTAKDNNTIALFMTNLKESPLIGEVNLISSKLSYLRAYNMEVNDFSLTCRLQSPPKPKKGGKDNAKAAGKSRR